METITIDARLYEQLMDEIRKANEQGKETFEAVTDLRLDFVEWCGIVRADDERSRDNSKRIDSCVAAINEHKVRLDGIVRAADERSRDNSERIDSCVAAINEHSVKLEGIVCTSGHQQNWLEFLRGKLWAVIGIGTALVALGVALAKLIP